MTHYEAVEFLSIFRMSSAPAQTQSPTASSQKREDPYWKLCGDCSG